VGLFGWLLQRPRALSEMTRAELRRQELLLEKERQRLMGRVGDLARKKQEVFERGAKEKTPEVRRALAQEFDLFTTEQLMVARQLNVRSKEAITVGRLRMLRENADRAKATGGKLGLVGARDLLALEKLIETDAVTAEMYQERLDTMLRAGTEQGDSGLTAAGRHVMEVWEQVDAGVLSDAARAFDEADRRVRQEKAAEGA